MAPAKNRLEPRKPPVQGRSRDTVELILSAAAQIFELHGYAAGTTNRIAERAGVSIGTLYQYYPSKEAIAVALVERHIDETSRRLDEWVAHMIAERHDLRAALHDYVNAMLDMHFGRPRLQHILLEETPLPDRVHLALVESERLAASTVGRFLRMFSQVHHGDPERAAFIMVQTVESLTHRFAAHPDEQQIIGRIEFVAELVNMLDYYLTAEDAGPKTD